MPAAFFWLWLITEKVSGGQSFLASIQNLLIFAIFKSSLNLNPIRHWSENWCPGYLEHALCSSEIHLAAAKSLEIIGHMTNCCKRPIGIPFQTNSFTCTFSYFNNGFSYHKFTHLVCLLVAFYVLDSTAPGCTNLTWPNLHLAPLNK